MKHTTYNTRFSASVYIDHSKYLNMMTEGKSFPSIHRVAASHTPSSSHRRRECPGITRKP